MKEKNKKITLLINMSTITVGGGVQASLTFIEFILENKKRFSKFNFKLILTESLNKQISNNDFETYILHNSPAHPIKGYSARKQLLKIEYKCKPDIIFSIGFPSYVKFKAAEIGRYTNPFEICNTSLAFSQLNLFQKLKRLALSSYRLYYAKNASFFITQTEIAKSGIINKLKISEENVFVSSNTINSRFIDKKGIDNYPRKNKNKLIFCLSAAHKHKNLELIPYVALSLSKKCNYDFKFLITLPSESDLFKKIKKKSKKLGVFDKLVNLGQLNLSSVYQQYKKCDCLFLPTLIEIFSATYLEAMAMQIPVVTTDLPFAREICGEAALYFDPLCAEDASLKLDEVLKNKNTKNDLIKKGTNQIKTYPSQEKLFEKILDFIEKCSYKN